ncbi:MAG: hypothetical protein WCO23_00480 [bacterium]
MSSVFLEVDQDAKKLIGVGGVPIILYQPDGYSVIGQMIGWYYEPYPSQCDLRFRIDMARKSDPNPYSVEIYDHRNICYLACVGEKDEGSQPHCGPIQLTRPGHSDQATRILLDLHIKVISSILDNTIESVIANDTQFGTLSMKQITFRGQKVFVCTGDDWNKSVEEMIRFMVRLSFESAAQQVNGALGRVIKDFQDARYVRMKK